VRNIIVLGPLAVAWISLIVTAVRAERASRRDTEPVISNA
jgi:hypothetical protein